MQGLGCVLGYKAYKTIQKPPSHPRLATLTVGGCDLSMCCAPSVRLPGAGGWRNMTVGTHMMASVAQSESGVV